MPQGVLSALKFAINIIKGEAIHLLPMGNRFSNHGSLKRYMRIHLFGRETRPLQSMPQTYSYIETGTKLIQTSKYLIIKASFLQYL